MEQTREQKLVEYLKRVTGELVEAKDKLRAVEAAATEPLAVVGMSCRFPGGGTTPARFWQSLLDGVNAVTEVAPDRWNAADWYDPDPTASLKAYTQHAGFLPDIAGWDAAFFGFPSSEALRIDPQHRLLHELVWEAVEDAGIAAETLRGSRTGVYVALADSRQYMQLENEADGPASVNDAFYTIGGSMSAAAGRLAYQLDLRGPVMTVDTACSSALVAVDLAVASLRRGECDQAIVCGSSAIVHPALFVQFCKMGMLAPDGKAKVFDKAGNGYTLGEGGGAVVLTRASDAEKLGRRTHALIRGSAVNSDGRSNGMTAPNKAAQIAVLKAALADSGLRPDDLDFLESQGTGTALGDSIEFGALLEVFGDRPADHHPLLVGAVKSNVGHLLVAAGFAGLIKAILALKHGELPTNLHLETPNAVVTLDGPVRPVRARQEMRSAPDAPRRAGVSAFGWSGTNAHVIVEQVPAPAVEAVESPEWQVLTLSASGDTSLRAVAAQLADHLESTPELSLADVAHTVQTGRAALRTRRAVLCKDMPDALVRLRGEIVGVEAPGGKVAAGLVLPGTTDLASVADLTEPAFRAALEECGELSGANVEAFAVEYALATLVRSQVPVAAVFGTGVGAYAADCVAGVRTVADGLALARALDGGATPIPTEPASTSRIPLAASAEDLATRVDVVVTPRFANRSAWLAELGRLWERGVAVRWATDGRFVDLPTYPFQRIRFWPEQTVPATWKPGDVIVQGPARRYPRPDIAIPYLAPRTRTERAVAEVWQDNLGVDAIGVDDPFFELGGTSVLGVGVMSTLAKEFDIDLPAASLFERPTVALVADLIDTLLGGAAAPVAATVDTQAARGARRRAIAQARNKAS